MNAPRSQRWLMLALLALTCLPLFAAVSFAADAATPILPASILSEIVSDRARLIQISLVIVALGCAMIWWYR
jgi:hypothetical protein